MLQRLSSSFDCVGYRNHNPKTGDFSTGNYLYFLVPAPGFA